MCGNPHGSHIAGRVARRAIEKARASRGKFLPLIQVVGGGLSFYACDTCANYVAKNRAKSPLGPWVDQVSANQIPHYAKFAVPYESFELSIFLDEEFGSIETFGKRAL